MNGVTVHVHNGIRYSVNSEGRCDWYSCTHNVYNSFDEPESVEVMRIITLNEHDMGCEHSPNDRVTCGTCQRSWCDICNPTPSARCLFEYEHDDVFEDEEDDKVYSPFGRDKRSVQITEEDAVELLLDGEYVKFRPVSELLPPYSKRDIEFCDAMLSHRTSKANGPCPVCGEFGGFHNDAKHRNNIPADKLLEKGWHNV